MDSMYQLLKESWECYIASSSLFAGDNKALLEFRLCPGGKAIIEFLYLNKKWTNQPCFVLVKTYNPDV